VSSPVDVLVVGAGPAGSVAARRLAEEGLSVLCIEQGDWPGQYRGTEPDFELTAAKQWSANPNVRQSPADYPVDLADSDVALLNFNGVGGGSVLYAAQWPRLMPGDFRVRSHDGVGDDWPIEYADLQRYYERTDRDWGVSGLGGNPMYPPGDDPPLPPLPVGEAGMRVARAHHRLGWHWWPEPNAILSAPYDGRHACIQRSTCMWGCNEGAKASSDITHWPKAFAAGARLLTNARVRRITTDRRSLANGVEWVERDGTEHFQPAAVVLCAANGVGTARLLLASANSSFPDGLANSSGLVGKRLMMHNQAMVFGLFEENLESWQGHWGASIQSLEFANTDEQRGFVRGARWALSPAGGPMRAALPVGRPAVWGADHHRVVRERFGRTAVWDLLCEDLPDDKNCVELSTGLLDSSGMPAPKISYTVADNARRMLEWNIDRATESLREAGAWKVEVARLLPTGHLMGTARMGNDPRTSVVDSACFSHDIPNLGIIDGSVFVTSGCANPTSTIVALALRACDQLLARRASLRAPQYPVGVAVAMHPTEPADRHAVEEKEQADMPVLTTEQRIAFAHVADRLIPGDHGMPAAGSVDVGGRLLDRVLSARPDLVPGLVRGLEWDNDNLDRLAAEDPAANGALTFAVVGAYYLDESVRAAIGYPGQLAKPVSPFSFPEYVAEGLLPLAAEELMT
jgi:choline dehydrogenase-like flavoprotein